MARTNTNRRNRHAGGGKPATVWIALALLALAAANVHSEIDISGFATLGGAISDQDFGYQRYVDDHGTLNRDSLVGVQLETRIGDAWSFTLQAKGAPSTHDDNAWEPSLTWAFLSWRPSNELLLRAGRLRVPLLLYSANGDVGTTYDFAHLPTETYSVSPTPDINGLSFTRTWLNASQEWTLEGYLGMAHSDWRFYSRDGLEPYFSAGAIYQGLDMQLGGLVLSLRESGNYWRIGLHRADAQADYGPIISDYPFVPIMPGVGYYQVLNQMPGPGAPTVETLSAYVLTLGAEIALPNHFKMVGEYVRRRLDGATLGPDVNAGYLGLLRRSGRWTPYLYWAGIRSDESALDLHERTNANRVPAFIPDAGYLNASQRLGADMIGAYDQQSLAIGTSYSLSPTSKLKAEWMHVRTGDVSSFVDAPPGEESGGRQINVFSLSYSMTF